MNTNAVAICSDNTFEHLLVGYPEREKMSDQYIFFFLTNLLYTLRNHILPFEKNG
jgi:hypothetical protein